MCGFIGVINYKEKPSNQDDFVRSCLDDLYKRGPDKQNIWLNEFGNVTFGFARLAIRDLSAAGDQPMSSSTGKLTMVYNGETYNTPELIDWANIGGLPFNGHSDTEIILACMQKMGVEETIAKMDGIFSIGLFDSTSNLLYLARDKAGVKPLYFGLNKSGIVFSSNYNHITSSDFFKDGEIVKESLLNYFKFGFIQEGEGILQNTNFVPHGCVVKIDVGKSSIKPIYKFFEDSNNYATDKGRSLLDVYKEVVKSQIVSDVPIGTFISGGVDSTLTSGVASLFSPKISAYTIKFKEKEYDESSEASRFSNYFDLNHIVKEISEADVLSSLKNYNESLGEPLADFSSLVTLKVCEMAKESLTVVLSGDGGDELFWGYARFKSAMLYYPLFKLNKFRRFIKICYLRLKGKPIPFELIKYSNFAKYYLDVQGLPGSKVWAKKLFKTNIKEDYPLLFDRLNNEFNTIDEAMDYAKALEFDIHMQRVLLKVDRASMFNSLEVRTPFLSTRFINKSRHYNFSDCVNDQVSKIPLRDALKEIIPFSASDSGNKKGFSPPMDVWLRTTLKDEVGRVVLKTPQILENIIDSNEILEIWNNHQNRKADNSWSIWAIYSLFYWIENKMFKRNAY
jgi:asparagine synthase (glutamine-hydrolysing)